MLTLRMNLIMKTAQGEHEHDMNGSESGIMQSLPAVGAVFTRSMDQESYC